MVCCQRYQDLPGFTHFGWIKDDEEYEPFMTDKLCVPQSFSKLVICSCKMYVCDSICCNNSNKGLICLLPTKLFKCRKRKTRIWLRSNSDNNDTGYKFSNKNHFSILELSFFDYNSHIHNFQTLIVVCKLFQLLQNLKMMRILIYCCCLLITIMITFCSSIQPNTKHIDKFLSLGTKIWQTIPSTKSLW